MIQAVIKIDKKEGESIVKLTAYFPYSVSHVAGIEQLENLQGSIDMKEVIRQNFEYELTKSITQETINDIRELENIILDCKDNNEAIKDALCLCQKLEERLKIKARYEKKALSGVIIDDPMPEVKPTREQLDEAIEGIKNTHFIKSLANLGHLPTDPPKFMRDFMEELKEEVPTKKKALHVKRGEGK